MKNKGKTNTKTITIIALVLLLSVVGIAFILTTQKKQRASSVDSGNVNVVETKNKENAKEFKTVFVEGVIEKVDDTSVTIKNGENEIPLLFANSFTIFEKNAEGESKSISDLKKDVKVIVEINQEDSMVTSVEIIK